MKQWKQKLILLFLVFGLCGCSGQGSVPAEPTSAVTSEAEAQKQTSGQSDDVKQEPADRYQEIINRTAAENRLALYFLDLETKPDAKDKAGDAMVLISPDNQVMVIDFGHPDAGAAVVQFLSDMNIDRIDYAVTTHPHIDHIGGFAQVVAAVEIGQLYSSALRHETQTYANYLAAIEKHEIPVDYLKAGDTLDFGDQIQIRVFNPGDVIEYPENFPDNSTQFLNNHSLLLTFAYGESVFLNGGDLYINGERDLVNDYGGELRADVVKANHHGKDTSNSLKWIKTVNPRLAVAMSDETVNMTVLEAYKKRGAEYYQTEYNGIVRVLMDDQGGFEVTAQFDSWLQDP